MDQHIDPISGYWLSDLSFLLNRFAPLRHLNLVNSQENKQKIIDSIYKDFPPSQEMYHELSGSTYENLRMPSFHKYQYQDTGVSFPMPLIEMQRNVAKMKLDQPQDWMEKVEHCIGLVRPDVDWMVVAGTKRAGYEELETDKTLRFVIRSDKANHPGYAWLNVIYPEETDRSFMEKPALDESCEYYLSATAIKQAMMKQLQEKKATLAFTIASASGPALNIQNLDKYVEEWRDIDVVFSFPCLAWPREAWNWVIRDRKSGWPNAESISQIMEKGCLLVPTSFSETGGESNLEWRFSFSVAERMLFEMSNDIQRQTLILLKFVKHFYFRESKILTTYHFKTALFWVTEDMPLSMWTNENLGKCFLIVLEKMQLFMSSGHFPQFFIEDCNLISKLSPADVKNVIGILNAVREDPVKPLLEFNKIFQVIYLPYTKHMSEILHAVLQKKNTRPYNRDLAVQSQLEALDELGKQFIIEYSYKEAVEVFKEYADLKKIQKIEFKPECRIMSLAFALDNPRVLTIYQVLLKEFPESVYKETMFSNLAGEYQNAYFNATEPARKENYKEKAEETYACAFSLPNCKLSTNVSYAHFLFNTKQYQDAVSFVESLRVEDASSLEQSCSNAYGKSYLASMDDPILKPEILEHGKLTLPSVALAMYLLTRCYQHLNKMLQAKNNLIKFRKVCHELCEQPQWKYPVVQSSIATMFRVLAKVAEDLQDVEIAEESSKKASVVLANCS